MSENAKIEATEPEILSPFEIGARKVAETIYRIVFATLVSSLLFYFLYNPGWLHGYFWYMNQPVDVDFQLKRGSVFQDRQYAACVDNERFVHAFVKVLCVWATLWLTGFDKAATSNSIKLFKLAVFAGCASGAGTSLVLKTRLLSVLHDGFFCYLNFFITGLVLMLQFEFDENSNADFGTTDSKNHHKKDD
uniref:Transmembrane protein n=1 Tax=Panagrellus redivivus TaxID=6233 RepID=A0A7E4ZYS9_PANRE